MWIYKLIATMTTAACYGMLLKPEEDGESEVHVEYLGDTWVSNNLFKFPVTLLR